MKRKLITILSLIVVVALSLGIFASCNKGLKTEQLDKLYNEFTKQYRDESTESPVSYYVNGSVSYLEDGGNKISANIKWTIEGTALVTVSAEADHMGRYQVNVPTEVTEPINYKLVGTMVDDNGKEYTDKDGNVYKLVINKVVLAGQGKGTQENPYSVSGALSQYVTVGVGEWSAEKFYVTGVVVTAPSYNSKYNSYTFWMADSKDSTNRLQIYSGQAASSITKICQNDTVVVNGYYLKYSATNPEMTGSTESGKEHDYPEITSRTAGTSSISFLPNENADVVLSKTSGVNDTTFTFTVTPKNNATISSVKVNNVEVTAANGTYTGTIAGDTVVSVVALVATGGEQTATINMETNFAAYAADWSNSYAQHTVDSAALGVTNMDIEIAFERAAKQAETIDNMPVMATNSNTTPTYTTITVNGDRVITSITINLKQWSASKKFKTIALEYTTNGEDWEVISGVGIKDAETSATIADYSTLSVTELPVNVTAVRLVLLSGYSSGNQQVGLESLVITVDDPSDVPPPIADPVAKIGGTGYETLDAALEAATEGQTITLQKDVVVTTNIVVGKKITLNLNGKTISNTADIWNDTTKVWSLISVRENGELTITGNGKLDAKANDCFAVDVRDGGKLIIENGEFIGNLHSVYVLKGSAEIKGGKYDLKQLDNAGNGHNYTLNLYDANGAAGTATISVTGGQFVEYNPAESNSEHPAVNFVAKGYVSTSKTEGEGEAQVTIWTVAVYEGDGTEAKPYTVAQARAIALALEGAESSKSVFNDKPVYVTGYVVSITAQDNFEIADTIGGTSVFGFYKGQLDAGVTGTLYINDTVVIYGYIANYSKGYKCQVSTNNEVKPLVKSIVVGDGSIKEAASNENATVAFNPAPVAGVVSGKNGTTVTFTVTVAEGYELASLFVGNVNLTGKDVAGVYTVTINGNQEVVVTVKVPRAEELKATLTVENGTAGTVPDDGSKKTFTFENNITLTNNKSASTSKCTTQYDTVKNGHIRMYQGSNISIDCTGMLSVVIECESGYVAGFEGLTVEGATVTVTGTTVTITFENAANTFTTSNLVKAVRVKSIAIYGAPSEATAD